jgi:hypothetical protein
MGHIFLSLIERGIGHASLRMAAERVKEPERIALTVQIEARSEHRLSDCLPSQKTGKHFLGEHIS